MNCEELKKCIGKIGLERNDLGRFWPIRNVYLYKIGLEKNEMSRIGCSIFFPNSES